MDSRDSEQLDGSVSEGTNDKGVVVRKLLLPVGVPPDKGGSPCVVDKISFADLNLNHPLDQNVLCLGASFPKYLMDADAVAEESNEKKPQKYDAKVEVLLYGVSRVFRALFPSLRCDGINKLFADNKDKHGDDGGSEWASVQRLLEAEDIRSAFARAYAEVLGLKNVSEKVNSPLRRCTDEPNYRISLLDVVDKAYSDALKGQDGPIITSVTGVPQFYRNELLMAMPQKHRNNNNNLIYPITEGAVNLCEFERNPVCRVIASEGPAVTVPDRKFGVAHFLRQAMLRWAEVSGESRFRGSYKGSPDCKWKVILPDGRVFLLQVSDEENGKRSVKFGTDLVVRVDSPRNIRLDKGTDPYYFELPGNVSKGRVSDYADDGNDENADEDGSGGRRQSKGNRVFRGQIPAHPGVRGYFDNLLVDPRNGGLSKPFHVVWRVQVEPIISQYVRNFSGDAGVKIKKFLEKELGATGKDLDRKVPMLIKWANDIHNDAKAGKSFPLFPDGSFSPQEVFKVYNAVCKTAREKATEIFANEHGGPESLKNWVVEENSKSK